jgi:hypothetical protein
MSLLRYQDARPWAKAIRNEVLTRRMPPFDAVKGIGEFRDDPSLTPPEMDVFVAWVEGGAPEGGAPEGGAPEGGAPEGAPTSVAPAVPQAPARATCSGQPIRLSRSTQLAASTTLCGIQPEGPLEVTALLPDESVLRLIWVHDFRPEWNRTYVFREPVELPKGTRILIASPKGAAARLFTSHEPER